LKLHAGNSNACKPAARGDSIRPAMIRFLLRFLGLCLLATAFFFLVYDGTKSIANQHVVWTDLEQAWALVDQDNLATVQGWVKQRAPWAWDSYGRKVFDLPFWVFLAVASMILILLGRKKKPLIGYARN
jgi:hypothetical protein